MSRTTNLQALSADLRQQLEISSALARERLMDVHFRYAMEFVDRARADVDPSRVLSIYSRLHRLRNEEVNDLHHRIFVALGRRGKRKSLTSGDAEEERSPESPRTIVGQIRRRLRGRVNTELREWVEYHTGRAETELLWAHVENALTFAELLEEVCGIGEAVTLYAEELEVPDSRSETIYYLALAHRSANTVTDLPVAGVDQTPRAFPEPALGSLRMVENRRTSRRRRTG